MYFIKYKDISSLLARFAGAKSCYKPSYDNVQIQWNEKWKKKKDHLGDDKSCEGIASKTVGKTLEKPNILPLIVFRIIKHL